jgi:hypothetical protein
MRKQIRDESFSAAIKKHLLTGSGTTMNFLDDLDALLEQAVNDTFGRQEKIRQVHQSRKIDKDHLRATSGKKDEDVDEAEDEEGSEDEDKKDKKSRSEKQGKLTGDPDKVQKQLSQRAAEKEREDSVPGTSTSKKLRDLTPEELKKPDFQTIAKNINLLRGGKSIKDKSVRKNLKAYIDKLSSVEKKEVLIYLNSLAQVMSGVKPGGEAKEPDHGSMIDTEKVKKQKLKTPKQPTSPSQPGVIVVGAS